MPANKNSSSDSSSGIRVLICSANLGNAQPDTASLNEWIPLNGQCRVAMPRPPRFPVVMDPRRAKNPSTPDDAPLASSSSADNTVQVAWTRNPAPHPHPPPAAAAAAAASRGKPSPPKPPTNNSIVDNSERSSAETGFGFLSEGDNAAPKVAMAGKQKRNSSTDRQSSSSFSVPSTSFQSDPERTSTKKKKKDKKDLAGSSDDDEDDALLHRTSSHSRDRKKKKKKDRKSDNASSDEDDLLAATSSHSSIGRRKKKKKDKKLSSRDASSDEDDSAGSSDDSSKDRKKKKSKKKKDKKKKRDKKSSRDTSSDDQDDDSSSSDDSSKDKKKNKKKKDKKKKRDKKSRRSSKSDDDDNDDSSSSEDSADEKRKRKDKKKRKDKSKVMESKSDDEEYFSSDSKEYEQDLDSKDDFAYDHNNDNDNSSDDRDSFADLATAKRSSLGGFLGATTPLERKNSSIQNISNTTHSNASSIRFDTNFPDGPSTPPPTEVKQRQAPAVQETGCFDIIVIGMQEATFDTDKSTKTYSKQDSMSEDGYISEMDEMDELVAEMNGVTDMSSFDFDTAQSNYSTNKNINDSSAFAESFDFDGVEATYSSQDSPQKRKSKSSAAKVLGATVKAGKVGLKAGRASYNASKKVVKTAKAVNTLATARDHTSRPIHSAQQVGAPVLDGGFPGWVDTDVLHYRFEDQLPNYDRALSYQLGEMRLVIYYNPIAVDLEVVTVKYQATGVGGLANKGGIVAEVLVNGSTRLSFLTAHLEAHEGEEKYATRCTSIMDILRGAKSSYTPIKFDASVSSHFTFAMGDLNFRTRVPNVEPGSERHIKIAHGMAAAKDWKLINRYDELASALRKRDCLVGFRTPYCNFDPTFKVARQDGYSYNATRSPSYTDRILFKTGDQLDAALRPILYEPIEKFTTSDHKPIRAAFSIRLNDTVRWKPAMSLKKSKRQSKDDEPTPKAGRTVNRETMNFFVSAIQVVIDPDSYDKIRKTKKAELPNSYLSFISTPPEAVQVDKSKKSTWKGLVGGKGKPGKSASDGQIQKILSSSGSKLSGGFPTTTTIKDTMKPNWKKESLHFTVRTHLVTGDPIDLSGALLHLCLFDKKDEKSIGTFSLNLARLITVTKTPSLLATFTSNNNGPPVARTASMPTSRSGGRGRGPPPPDARGGGGGGRGAGGPTSSAGGRTLINRTNSSSGGGAPLRPSAIGAAPSSPGGAGVVQRGGGGAPAAGRAGRAGPVGPAAGRGAASGGQRGGGGGGGGGRRTGPPRTSSTAGRGPPQLDRRGSLKAMSRGPSMSMRAIISADKDAPEPGAVESTLRDLKIVSLQLDEGLMEGGLEVARIKCNVDIWWEIEQDEGADVSWSRN